MLDTAALIELQKWGSKLFVELRKAQDQDLAIMVPAPVLVEWLAGGSTANLNRVLELVDIIELTEDLARTAAKGLQGVGHPACKQCAVRGGPSVVDAVVMALAHQEGDTVYTQDPKDLTELNEHFDRAVVKVC
ncbi:MAG: PIN domain-containing protein [Byssovorax sp.]